MDPNITYQHALPDDPPTMSPGGDLSVKKGPNITYEHALPDDEPIINPGGGRRAKYETSKGERTLWTPFLLRRTTMLLFVGVFCSLLALLVGLYIYSKQNNGILTVNSKYYYLWKFGPTTVFIIVGAFWDPVHYLLRQLAPWAMMLRRQQPASAGILLDYTSDNVVVALFKSLRRKHFTVVLGAAASILLTGATIFASGLLAENTIQMHRDEIMQVTQKYNASDPHTYGSKNIMTDLMYWRSQRDSLQEMDGVHGPYAFPDFGPFIQGEENATGYEPDHEYEASVDVFALELDECEPIASTAKPRGPYTLGDDPFQVSTSYKNCSMVTAPSIPSYDPLTKNGLLRRPPHNIQFYSWNCGNDGQFKLFTVMIHREADGISLFSLTLDEFRKRFDRYVLSMMCTPRYGIYPGLVTLRTGGDGNIASSMVEVDKSTARTLPKFNMTDLIASVGSGIFHTTTDNFSAYDYVFPRGVTSEPLDFEGLQLGVWEFWPRISAWTVKSGILQNTNSSFLVNGTIRFTEQRLVMQDLSFGLLVATLVLLLAATITLYLTYLPLSVCSRSPGSIGGFATILSRSKEFVAGIENLGTTTASEMKRFLCQQENTTAVTRGGDFKILLAAGQAYQEQHQAPDECEMQWWRPFAARLPARYLTIIAPLAIIGVLEGLNQYSRKSGFLVALSPDNLSYTQYTWTYIPTIFMLGMALLYHQLEEATRVFQKFHFLRRGGALAQEGILDDYDGKLSLYVLWNAVGRRYWALAAANTAALLSFALPIASSGLYSTQATSQPVAANVTLLDRVGVMPSDGPYYSKGWTPAASLVFGTETGFPQGTYRNFVLPRFTVDEAPRLNGSLDIRLPAIQLNMNCVPLPQDEYSIKWRIGDPTKPDDKPTGVAWNITVSRPKECQPYNIDTFIRASADFSELFTYSTDSPIGGYSPLLRPSLRNCSVLYHFFGKATDSVVHDRPFQGLAPLKCRPRLEQLEVDFRLSFPSQEVKMANPVPNTVQVLYDAVYKRPTDENTPKGTGYGPQDGIYNIAPDYAWWNYWGVDGLTQGGGEWLQLPTELVVYGPHNLTAEELLNPATYAAALNSEYAIVAAQMLHASTREMYNETGTPPPVRSASFFKDKLVLVQSTTSSRILQGLLAAMTLCGLAAMFLIETRRVLVNNPGSIAGMASLLAGSEMVSENAVPAGSEWCDDHELKRRGVFDNYTFSLKWWDNGMGSGGKQAQRYGIDMDKEVSAAWI